MNTLKSILTLALILLPVTFLNAADKGEARIWMDEPGFDKPDAGKWWLSGTERITTDKHDGTHALSFPLARARCVSNFPFEIKTDKPFVRMELWARNIDTKESQLLVKLDVRQRKTNKYLRNVQVAKVDIPVSNDWQKLTVTFKVPDTTPEDEYFKLELYNNWGNFLLDDIKAFSVMEDPADKNKEASEAK